MVYANVVRDEDGEKLTQVDALRQRHEVHCVSMLPTRALACRPFERLGNSRIRLARSGVSSQPKCRKLALMLSPPYGTL